MQRVGRGGPLVALVVAALTLAAQDRFAGVEIEALPVRGSVSMLIGQGGNIGVCAGPDGLVVVDNQFLPLAEKIQAALDAMDSGELRYMLNTHHHGDHTGGNEFFGDLAPIVAQENVRQRLEKGGPGQQPAKEVALPVITFQDELKLFVNGETIRLRHHADCHTDGDSVVWFEDSNVVHMGDLFFKDSFPFVDVAAGGNVQNLITAIAAVLERVQDDTFIIPGHGALANREDLVHYHEMLRVSLEFVSERKRAGKSLQDMQKEGLGPDYREWGKGFINEQRWLGLVYSAVE